MFGKLCDHPAYQAGAVKGRKNFPKSMFKRKMGAKEKEGRQEGEKGEI